MARRQRLRLQPRTPLGLLWADWINGYAVGHERLAKSLDYAEGGAVSDLRIDGSTVEAIVRGNSPQPYQVIWQFSPIDKQRWKLFWSAMSPEAIREYRKGAPGLATEAALAAADIHLLPERYKHLRPACTCPDWIRIKMDPDAIFKPVYEGVASEARQVVESILRKDKKP